MANIATFVHRTLTERGRTPLDVRTLLVVEAIESFEARTDLRPFRAEAEELAALKRRLEDLQLQQELSTCLVERASASVVTEFEPAGQVLLARAG